MSKETIIINITNYFITQLVNMLRVSFAFCKSAVSPLVKSGSTIKIEQQLKYEISRPEKVATPHCPQTPSQKLDKTVL